jgi:ribonuclease I
MASSLDVVNALLGMWMQRFYTKSQPVSLTHMYITALSWSAAICTRESCAINNRHRRQTTHNLSSWRLTHYVETIKLIEFISIL